MFSGISDFAKPRLFFVGAKGFLWKQINNEGVEQWIENK
jgi:hypothetical protein